MNITDGSADVYQKISRTARRRHTCCACREEIRPGDSYTLSTIIYDHNVDTYKRCLRCEMIHAHLCEMRQGTYFDDLWPSESLDCGESYEDVFETSAPEHIQALAFALPSDDL